MFTSLKFYLNYTSLPSFCIQFLDLFGYPLIIDFSKRILDQKWVNFSVKNYFNFVVILQFKSFDNMATLSFTDIYFKVKLMYSKNLLWELRTNLPMLHVLEKLEHLLHLPFKESEGFTRFLCVNCNEMQATINTKNNLSHCFACDKNLNNIDLMIANGYTFSKSVDILTVLWEEYKKRSQAEASTSTWQ